MVNWWEGQSNRLAWEEKQLQTAGIKYQVDEDALKQNHVSITLWMDIEGFGKQKLVAKFPDDYPWFRFEVYAPGLDLELHQNPFEKNLCLIDKPLSSWLPSDSLAAFLVKQLPKVIQANSIDGDDAVEIETIQPEPVYTYLLKESNDSVLIDSGLIVPSSIESGKMKLHTRYVNNHNNFQITSITDAAKVNIVNPEPIFTAASKTITANWYRVDKPIMQRTGEKIFQELKNIKGGSVELNYKQLEGKKDEYLAITAILYPEQTEWRKNNDGWLFLLHHNKIKGKKPKAGRAKGSEKTILLQTERAGKIDLAQRVPHFSLLQNKKILLLGLGSLGSTSAIEFAKNGIGELIVLDHDQVEPGNSVRWALGLGYTGMAKTEAINQFLIENFPYTKVQQHYYRIGDVNNNGGRVPESQLFKKLLDEVDLVFDATGDEGVQRYISHKARLAGVPYIAVSTNEGSWGGFVFRILPDFQKGCWDCFKHHIKDNTIPVPRYDAQNGTVAPIGCSSPTFIGASFDSGPVIMAGVRVAVSDLTEGAEFNSSYIKEDVQVLNLRNQSGQSVLPSWEGYELKNHEECSICHTKQ